MLRYKDPDDETMLRDGEVGRVRMMMRDSLDGFTDTQRAVAAERPADWMDSAERYFSRRVRITDGSGDTVGLHRPGHRINPRDARERVERAYQAYDAEIAVAYKSPMPPTTRATRTGLPPARQQHDALSHMSVMDQIYKEHDRWLEQQWRTR